MHPGTRCVYKLRDGRASPQFTLRVSGIRAICFSIPLSKHAMDKFAQVNSQSQDYSGKRRAIGEDLGICDCIAYRHETISSDGGKRNYEPQLEDVLMMKGCRSIDHIANRVKISRCPSFRYNFATLYRNCATCISLRAH